MYNPELPCLSFQYNKCRNAKHVYVYGYFYSMERLKNIFRDEYRHVRATLGGGLKKEGSFTDITKVQ